MPHPSGAERGERARQAGEEFGLGMTGREGQTDAAGGFYDTGGDLEEPQPQGRELGPGQIALFGNGVAHGQHQPIGSGVQDQPNLIGDGGTAGRAIRRELRLVQLDQVLRLSACAIQAFVEPLGRAVFEIGDDEADIETERLASIRATARRSRVQDLALWRVSA